MNTRMTREELRRERRRNACWMGAITAMFGLVFLFGISIGVAL